MVHSRDSWAERDGRCARSMEREHNMDALPASVLVLAFGRLAANTYVLCLKLAKPGGWEGVGLWHSVNRHSLLHLYDTNKTRES